MIWTVGIDAATITETLALAASGDTIELPAGTYTECVDTGGKSVTIEGEGATIDGTGLCDNTVRVVYGETVTIADVTVVNTTGRAFDLEWSTVTLDGVTVTGTGRSDWSGGGIWAYGAALTTTNCVFTDNTAYEGGAVYLYAYATWSDTNSTFERNTSAASGGAVMAYYDNAITLVGDVFEDNEAGYYGGAVATWDYTDLTVADTSFAGNAAATTGGGAIFYYPVDSAAGVLAVSDSGFSENTAADGGAFWIGWANDATLTSNTFTSNVASSTGGAVLAYVTGTTRLLGNTFCTNSATTGGAVSVQWTTTDTWTNNVFAENEAANGGAAHRYAAYAGTILQNTFAGNGATGWGGAYYASWAYADVRNNVFADSPSGVALYTAEAASSQYSAVTYDGWADNEVTDAAGYFYVVGDTDGNVVAEDPGFVLYTRDGACDDDLRLTGASSFKDAGDPKILDPDGTRSDMGAWGGPDAPVADHDADGADTTSDCDDTSPDAYPGAPELCNGVDDDCDGAVDEDATDAETWYTDADGDGYGDGDAPVAGCEQVEGTADNTRDCDDTDRWISPDASDLPGDGVDADCDGVDNTQVIPAAPPAGADGCGCDTSGGQTGLWLGIGAALGLLRRRRGLHTG